MTRKEILAQLNAAEQCSTIPYLSKKKKFKILQINRLKVLGYSCAEIASALDPPMTESEIRVLIHDI